MSLTTNNNKTNNNAAKAEQHETSTAATDIAIVSSTLSEQQTVSNTHSPLSCMITDFVRRTAQTCRHNELITVAKRLTTPAKSGAATAAGGSVDGGGAVADEQHITRILAREFQSFVLIMSKACRVLYADDNVVQQLIGGVGGGNDETSAIVSNVSPVTTLVGENLLHYVHVEDQAKTRIQLRQSLDETILNSNNGTFANSDDFLPLSQNNGVGRSSSVAATVSSKPFKLPSAIEPLCAFAVRLRSGIGASSSVISADTASVKSRSSSLGGGQQSDTSLKPAGADPSLKFPSTSVSPAPSSSSPTAVWMRYHLCLLKGNWIKTNASSMLTANGSGTDFCDKTAISFDDAVVHEGGDGKPLSPPVAAWSKKLLSFLLTSDTSHKELDYIWFGVVKVVKPNAMIMSPNCFTMTLGLMPLPPGADACGIGGKNDIVFSDNSNGSNASTPNSTGGSNGNSGKKESKKRMKSGDLSSSTVNVKANLTGDFLGKLAILDVDQRCTCLTGFFASEMSDTQFLYYIHPFFIPVVVNNLTKMILRESDICTCTVKMRNAYENYISVDILLTVTAQPHNRASHPAPSLSSSSATATTAVNSSCSQPVLFLGCVVSPTQELNEKKPGVDPKAQIEEIAQWDTRLSESVSDAYNCCFDPKKLRADAKLSILSGRLFKLYESVLALDNNAAGTLSLFSDNTNKDALGGEPECKRPRTSINVRGKAHAFYCTPDEHAFVPMPLNITRNDLSSPTVKNFGAGFGSSLGERRPSLHAPRNNSADNNNNNSDNHNGEPNHVLLQQLINGSGVFDDAVTRARMLEASQSSSNNQQHQYISGGLLGGFPQNSQPLPAAVRKLSTSINNMSQSPLLQQQLPPSQLPEIMKDRQLKELLNQPIDSEKRFRCINLGPAVPQPPAVTQQQQQQQAESNNRKLLNGGAVVTVSSSVYGNSSNNNNMTMLWGGNASNVGGHLMMPHNNNNNNMAQGGMQFGPPGGGGGPMVMQSADGTLYSSNVMMAPRGQMIMMPMSGGGPQQQFMSQQSGGTLMMSGVGQVSPNFSPSPGGSNSGGRNVRIMSPSGQQQQIMLSGGGGVRPGTVLTMRPNGGMPGPPGSMLAGQQLMMETDARGQMPMYYGNTSNVINARFQSPHPAAPSTTAAAAAAAPLSPASSLKQQQPQQQQNAPVRQLQQQLREKHHNIEHNLKMQDEDLARMKQDVGTLNHYAPPHTGGAPPAATSSGGGDFSLPAPPQSLIPTSSSTSMGGSGGGGSPQQQQVVERISRLQQRTKMQSQELGVLNVKLAAAASSSSTSSSAAGPPPPNVALSPITSSPSNMVINGVLPATNKLPNNTNSSSMPPFIDQQVVMMQNRSGAQLPLSYTNVPMQQQQQQRPTFAGGNTNGPGAAVPSMVAGRADFIMPTSQQQLAMAKRQQQQQQQMNYAAGPPPSSSSSGGVMLMAPSNGGMIMPGGYMGGQQLGQPQPGDFYSSQNSASNNNNANNDGGLLMDGSGDATNDAFFDDLFSTLEANTAVGGGGTQSNGRQSTNSFLNDFMS